MNRRRVLATGAGLVLAGCVSFTADDAPSSDDLVSDALETRRGMTDLSARRTMTVETPEETLERTEAVAVAPPASQRIEVLESTDPSVPAGSVVVTNRDRTWEYSPATDLVDRQYHPNKVDADRTQRVLEGLLEDYRLEYGGTATVDGREAHVVEARPPVDGAEPSIELLVGDTTYLLPLGSGDALEELDVSRTIWIDDEYRYPCKEEHAVSDEGGTRHRIAVTYEDLEIDTGLDSETFTYEPPLGATVVTDGPEPDGVFDSIDEAAAAVPYDLPDPDVSDAFVLDRVTVVVEAERFGTTTTLWYDDPNVVARELFVRVREVKRVDPSASSLEEIEIDGLTAYRRDGYLQSIFWACGELNYEVTSLTEDEPLEEIATSIGCP